jgi:hypothetical protein
MKRWSWLVGAVLVLLLAAAVVWLRRSDVPSVPIAGEPAPLARADAQSEFILPEALEAVRVQAADLGVRALIVHRRGHRVFEHFADGDGNVLIEGGELASAVLELALHEPGQAAALEAPAAAELVSQRLWLPLRAGEAWLSVHKDEGPRRCCIRARLDDWMRVGDLLLGQGAYHGERIVAADAARQVLAAHPDMGEGDEPFLARDPAAFDLAEGARLWLAPRRNLAILVWADDARAHDTLLPNIILRGLNDASPAIGGIDDLVPGH